MAKNTEHLDQKEAIIATFSYEQRKQAKQG
jgi:hypothetical protein